jgi:hypothetical protein
MEQILVYLIVAAAALYLLRGAFARRKNAGCGGCHGCPSSSAAPEETPPEPELVQIELTPRRRI